MKNTSVPHIVVVSPYFYPKIGGLENYAYLLAKELHQSGQYRVSIITSNYDGKGYKKETLDGMAVHRLPIAFKVSNTPVNLLWYWQVKAIFKLDPPQLVHLHSPVAYLPDMAAMAAAGIPVVLTYHAGSMIKHQWPIDMLISLYERTFLSWLFKRADAIITISQTFAKRRFPQYIFKMYFIPTGIDLKKFIPTPLPQSQTAMFIGRIEQTSSWKGIEPLLQAMALVLRQLPKATLEFIGGGDAVEHYRNRAGQLGIAKSVTFQGVQRGADLVEAYARANVVVLPSTTDAEAYSTVLVEAMASGRPIIGTDIGGTPQVIEQEKNGLLVAPNDPSRLAEAMIRVLSDRAFAQRLAQYGLNKVQDFSWDIQAKKYAQLFQRLLSEDEK